jgi:phosphomannomutase
MYMESPIKFGTDGWRGIIAADFTYDNVRLCAQGVAEYLKNTGDTARGLVIGYDTRFASEGFAAAVAEVVAGNGIKVYLCPEATPTPVVSYGVVAKKAAGAIMLTASHNPAAWNGFKYKTDDGASAPTEVVEQIEKNIALVYADKKVEKISLKVAEDRNLLEYFDIDPVYFAHIGKLVDVNKLKQSKLRVVIDPMFGAGIGYLKRLLTGGSMELTEIDNERNPLFPGMKQPEPIAVNLAHLTRTIKRKKAGAGIATDGDADRLGVMDENGEFLTTLQTFALLCLYLLEVKGERGVIVRTETSTSMADRLGEIYHVPVIETAVGFKYVAPIMLKENAIIGGEESGGYGFRGHVPERDGILAALYFLDLMVSMGKTPSELVSYLYRKVGPHYFDRWDLEFPEAEREAIINRVKNNTPATLSGVKVIKVDTFDGFRFTLADGAWLLVRFSGTEPLLRIYAEAGSPEQVEKLLTQGKELAGIK